MCVWVCAWEVSSQTVRLLEWDEILLVTVLKGEVSALLFLFMGSPCCPFHLFTAFLWSIHSRSLKVVMNGTSSTLWLVSSRGGGKGERTNLFTDQA